MDGALTMGGPGTQHIVWRNPSVISQAAIDEAIKDRLKPLPTSADKFLKAFAREAGIEVRNAEAQRTQRVAEVFKS